MKEKLAKLIDVKSIVTILLTLVVIIQTLRGQFDIREFYIMIISFFFGAQSEKNKKVE